MKQLLIIRDRIKVFAGKNEAWLLPLFKFLMTFILMLRINSKLGFMARLSGLPIAMIVALAGSFLPINLTIVILGLVIVAHLYALSLVTAVLVFALFFILFLLYYRFASQDAVGSLLLQVSYVFGIPSVIPVSMGLTGTPISMVSVGFGAIVHYVLEYVSVHAKELAAFAEEESLLAGFKEIVDALLGNKIMYVAAIAYAVTVLVVYVIRRLPIDFCWYIAIAVGSLICFIVLLAGGRALGVSIAVGSAFLGVLISIILNTILQFFCFSLDYNRTEKVQFEDDEYYYYVKAIPKRNSGITDNVIRPAKKKPLSSKVLVRVPAEGRKTVAASESSPYRSQPARPTATAKPSTARPTASARPTATTRSSVSARPEASSRPARNQGVRSGVIERATQAAQNTFKPQPKPQSNDSDLVMTFVDDDTEGK